MAERVTLDLPEEVTRRAKAVAQATGQQVEAVLTDWLVRSADSVTDSTEKYSLGSVTGTLAIVEQDNKKRVVVYDSLFDVPVHCNVDATQLANMEQLQGQRVVVAGRIGRHAVTGIPISISNIMSITPTTQQPTALFETANGILSVTTTELPEDTVRRLRDEN